MCDKLLHGSVFRTNLQKWKNTTGIYCAIRYAFWLH